MASCPCWVNDFYYDRRAVQPEMTYCTACPAKGQLSFKLLAIPATAAVGILLYVHKTPTWLKSHQRKAGSCTPCPGDIILRVAITPNAVIRTVVASCTLFNTASSTAPQTVSDALHCKKGKRFSRSQPGCHLPNSPWPGIWGREIRQPLFTV